MFGEVYERIGQNLLMNVAYIENIAEETKGNEEETLPEVENVGDLNSDSEENPKDKGKRSYC
jgi:hypothetical protein